MGCAGGQQQIGYATNQCADLDALIAHITTKRTAKAWLYREQLRDILERKQINVVSAISGGQLI